MDQRREATIADENEALKATSKCSALNRLPSRPSAGPGRLLRGAPVISACDVVIAADNAVFSITEVRWG